MAKVVNCKRALQPFGVVTHRRTHHPCVVDEQVETVELGPEHPCKRSDAVDFGQIQQHKLHRLTNQYYCISATSFALTREYHVFPAQRQRLGSFEANPAIVTGHS
ncbi:hypothetical protein P3T76_001073 [Phytophthora citrophthora]|uniref:Uncharacterized protein n=1 Tax=Phytophthora citrophthora TaxID=4793 RepID=A0AAD9LRN7_9STRA|nr:hypothetical protein P3T76_001073 [Phytophthora citrophthora]